jgi:hypothetical protein
LEWGREWGWVGMGGRGRTETIEQRAEVESSRLPEGPLDRSADSQYRYMYRYRYRYRYKFRCKYRYRYIPLLVGHGPHDVIELHGLVDQVLELTAPHETTNKIASDWRHEERETRLRQMV